MFHRFTRSAKAYKVLGLAAIMCLALSANSFAVGTTYDLSPAASGITDQISAVLLVVLPIAGGLLALTIGWKLLKRFVRA